jgi:hypothetical protein
MRYVWPERTFGPGMESLNERQLQKQIISTASFCGFSRAMHIPYSADMPQGFPDLTLVRSDQRAPDIVFFEIKGPRGKVKQNQLDWLADLRASAHHAYLVQPKDWPVIVDILRNVWDPPHGGDGEIDPDLEARLSMDQATGAR